jgi:hypothetical protein
MKIIDVNMASKFDLQELIGIGSKLAETIIQERPYICPNQLLDIDGMSENLLISLEKQGLWVDSELAVENLHRSQQMEFIYNSRGGCG